MKKQKLLFAILSVLFLFVISACSDKDDTDPQDDPQNQAPTYLANTVTVPDAMAQSNDQGAQMANMYVSMANGFAGFAGMMTPPPYKSDFKSTNDGDPWIYTWEFVEGSDAYTITLTIFETVTQYEWTMVINGVLGGVTLTDFMYMEANQNLDGTAGAFYMYDPDQSGDVMSVVWSTDANGVYYLTFEFTNDVKIELVSNPDGSGQISVYEWAVNVYQLTFEAIWDATGSGEWWEYYNGVLENSGTW